MSIEEFELLTNSVSLANAPSPTKSIRFQNLKLLKLCGISFNTHSPKSPNYIQLKLSFPLLKKFETKNCAWFVDATWVSIDAPLLESISIEHDVDVPYNIINPSIFFSSCLYQNEFSYCGYDIPLIILTRSPCHTSAKIILHEGQGYMVDFEVFSLLRNFSHAKSIKFEVSKVCI
jgi:hypothetical protein